MNVEQTTLVMHVMLACMNFCVFVHECWCNWFCVWAGRDFLHAQVMFYENSDHTLLAGHRHRINIPIGDGQKRPIITQLVRSHKAYRDSYSLCSRALYVKVCALSIQWGPFLQTE